MKSKDNVSIHIRIPIESRGSLDELARQLYEKREIPFPTRSLTIEWLISKSEIKKDDT